MCSFCYQYRIFYALLLFPIALIALHVPFSSSIHPYSQQPIRWLAIFIISDWLSNVHECGKIRRLFSFRNIVIPSTSAWIKRTPKIYHPTETAPITTLLDKGKAIWDGDKDKKNHWKWKVHIEESQAKESNRLSVNLASLTTNVSLL